MNWQTITFDWNQVRAFLATAEEGSLSAAARALGTTQPTLSRQVAALEETLEVRLFERAGRTLVLTDTGHMLLTHVRKMGEAAGNIALAVSGQAATLEGEVTITASDMTSAYTLPPILARLAQKAPGLEITVVAANEIRDLQRREADIALRNAAPVEPELIARRLKDTRAIFCAAPAFLDAHGPIETKAALEAAPWVGYGPRAQMSEALRGFGYDVAPDRFRHNCATGVVQWEMVRHGMGVGIMDEDFLKVAPDLVRLLPDTPPITIPLYLISHSALRNSARMRAVWDALAEALG